MTRGTLIRTRLGQLVRQRLANDLAALVLAAAAMTAAAVLVIAALFWSGWLLAAVLLPVGYICWRWLRGSGLEQTARDVEATFPEVKEKLVAARQLAQYEPESREDYSLELLEAAVQQVEAALAPLPLRRLVHRKRLLWSGLALCATLLLLFGFKTVFPARAAVGLTNAFAPARLNVEFTILPGDTAVMPGGTAVLRCRVQPAGVFGGVRLEQAGKTRQSRRLRLQGDTCRIVLPAENGFRYRFRVLAARSSEYRVRVLEPLALDRLTFTYHFPEYSGLPESRSTSTDISALRGTVIDVAGELKRPVSSGRLVLGGESLGISLDPKDSSRFSSRFVVKADAEGMVVLTDMDNGVAQSVAALRVRAVADEPPFVKLFMPGRDVDLPVSMKVLLGVNSLDDFGLGELYLHYGKDTIDKRVRLKALGGRREDTTLYTWDLSGTDLLPGEAMRYYVSVTDNDRVSGPKTGRSEVFSVRFPTMTEIYSAGVRRTERTANELGPMQSQQEAISQEMNRVAEEMKRSRELSWDEKQALQKALSSQEGLMDQIEALKQDVQQMVDELSQGMMLDQETMERMGQLQELLSQMLPRELQQSLAQLRQKMEQQSPDMKRALDNFQMDQEKLKEAIDRALELLKKIAEEQRLEALARKADELAKAQEKLTDKLGKEPADKSAEMQQNIKDALDSLQKEMAALADSMSDKEIADSLSGLSQETKEQKLSEQAGNLQSQMQQGKTGESKEKSGKLGKSLRNLSKRLNSLSERLKQKRSSDVAQKLAGAARDLLMLSDEQEKLEKAVTGMQDVGAHAPQQMGLHEGARIAAESLAAMASQSMSVPPQLGQELAKAMNSMQEAAQAMVDNRGQNARQSMGRARLSLNRTVQGLLDAMAQAQKGGGMSGGLESMMEQLSKMTGEQMGINGDMGGIPMPMPGGLSDAQMQMLARILSRQQALRQQLEQMLQGAGGTQPGLTSSLEGLLDEMKAVERDLAELNINRELVQRQESILSHLLDAQRSIRQQGFKEERQSETGKTFELKERPRLPADKGERNRLLREELMRALKQGYPAEYEQMIRSYFEKLLNQP